MQGKKGKARWTTRRIADKIEHDLCKLLHSSLAHRITGPSQNSPNLICIRIGGVEYEITIRPILLGDNDE